MSHDLLVFASDRVTTLRAAVLLGRALLAGAAGGDPTPPLDGLVSEVGTWPDVHVVAGPAAVVLRAPERDGSHLLPHVLRATADRGLAVADLRTPMLYDPRGHVDVTVRLGDDRVLPYLSRSLLGYLLPLPGPYPWLIVEREPEVYVQTYRLSDLSYELEHRAGGEDQHYRTYTPDAALVHRAIWWWVTGDPRWRDLVPWHRIDL